MDNQKLNSRIDTRIDIYIYTHTPIDKRNRTSWKGIADCTRGFVSRSITLPICQKLLEHEVIYSHVEYMCRGNYHIMGSRKWSAPAQIINEFKKASAGWPKSCGEASERASERPRARPYFLELSTNASNGIGRLIHRVYENVSRRPIRVSTKLSPRNDHFSLLFIDSKKRRFFVCRRTIPRTDFPRLARACARARNILRK